MSDQHIVIGIPGRGSYLGIAHVFQRNKYQWVFSTTLKPWNFINRNHYSTSVAISGNYIFVGDASNRSVGTPHGLVYVFENVNGKWIRRAKLMARDNIPDDGFGKSIDVFEDYLVIGAQRNTFNLEHPGAVYIFQRDGNTWKQRNKLLPLNSKKGDFFGHHVSISDKYILVNYTYLFQRYGEQWKQIATLDSSPNIIRRMSNNYLFEYNIPKKQITIRQRIGDQWSSNIKTIPAPYAGYFDVSDDYLITRSYQGSYIFPKETWQAPQ